MWQPTTRDLHVSGIFWDPRSAVLLVLSTTPLFCIAQPVISDYGSSVYYLLPSWSEPATHCPNKNLSIKFLYNVVIIQCFLFLGKISISLKGQQLIKMLGKFETIQYCKKGPVKVIDFIGYNWLKDIFKLN